MTRRAARVDANHSAVVLALVARGWTVQTLASVGVGCPDLLVGARGCNVLLEIKDGSKPASARKLTPDQRRWHRHWQGQVAVVHSEAEAAGAVLAEIARRWPQEVCNGDPSRTQGRE